MITDKPSVKIKNISYVCKIHFHSNPDISATDYGFFYNFQLKNFNNVILLQKIFKELIKLNLQPIASITMVLSNDLHIKPFWNSDIQKLSDKLFLPSFDNLKFPNKTIKTFNCSTWFNVNHYKSLDLNPYKLKTSKNIQINDTITKSRKIKLFLNAEQRSFMKQIIGTYRYYYNRTVSIINNYDKNNHTSWFYLERNKFKIYVPINNPYDISTLRPIIKQFEPKWLLIKFPSHLMDEAIRECIYRFKTCLSTFKKYGKPFEFRFKKKSNLRQTINLEKSMINTSKNSLNLFVNWKLNDKFMFRNISKSEDLNKYGGIRGSSLTYHSVLKTFILNLTYTEKTKLNNKKEVASIDPGLRKFVTIYSPSQIVEIGKDGNKRLYKVCKEIDIIKSRMDSKNYFQKDVRIVGGIINYKVTSSRRRSLRKALHRKIQYLKNLKDEIHNKTINYLCTNYKKIIYPPFKSQELADKLTSKLSRTLYNYSFYKFKEKLINKGKETNTQIMIKPEYYTSMTCGKCGNIKTNLGRNELYECNKCGLKIDRDYNASRNILLRNIKYI